ncbi:PREDICTED: uncharacterized protein LOC109347033 [Lupinus angustifolius]|uniref:uncharacterized protein LOC109347033 n=1 Tax=Lupinus angustifolius TaxID=3871 RepID=UPI00092E536F|nr:PREDICTED: uncharacterized protein LOC109347033 [Lupinus angustifolius]
MVISWIKKSLSQHLAQSTIYIDNAQEIWEDLKEIFSNGDYFRTSDLLQEIHSIRQGNKSVFAFFIDVKILWEGLESLRPIPTCPCRKKCESDLLKAIKTQRETEYVICFLKSLSDQYNTTKSQILLMEPLPSINKVFAMVQQQERQLTGSNVGENKESINNVNKSQNWRGHLGRNPRRGNNHYDRRTSSTIGGTWSIGKTYNANNNKVCTFCGRERHTTYTCYFKYGFPPNFKFKPRPNNGPVNSVITPEEETHQIDTGDNANSRNKREDQSQLRINLDHSINQIGNTSPIDNNQSITGNPLGNSLWILDTGATDHVNNLLNFTYHKSIKPIHVKLPNNLTIIAKKSGTVILSKSLTLHNVLYMPDFKYNLISHHKLACSLMCKLVFDKSSCLIQDMIISKMIGHSEAFNHLYILQRHDNPENITFHIDSSPSISSNSCFDLWHPSHVVLDNVHNFASCVKIDLKKVCEYCHLAK